MDNPLTPENITREEQVKKYAPEVFGVKGNPYAIAFMDGIKFADEHPLNPWISVEERLPEKTDVYYVRTRQGCADMAYFNNSNKKWGKGRFTDGTVTYWMPIPQIKKGE